MSLNNQLPGAIKGCKIGPKGKCDTCPHYRSMPVDVTNPTTGQVIKQGTVWDCVFAWTMLGTWDAGRQTQGVHAAVSQQTNETVKRQDEFLELVSTASAGPRRINHANGQNQ